MLATPACDLCPQLLFANRSAAYFSVGSLDVAVEDALRSVALDPTWVKVRRPLPLLVAAS